MDIDPTSYPYGRSAQNPRRWAVSPEGFTCRQLMCARPAISPKAAGLGN